MTKLNTPEQKLEREYYRAYRAAQRARVTEEQREKQREKQREYARRRRANMTEEELLEYVTLRLNSCLGFRGQVRKLRRIEEKRRRGIGLRGSRDQSGSVVDARSLLASLGNSKGLSSNGRQSFHV